jgi:putative flippase GtrA
MDALFKLLPKRLLPYLLSGCVAFAVEYTSFLFFYYLLNFHLLVANSTSFLAGLIVSFSLNRLWVFNEQEHAHKSHKQLILYFSLALTNLIIINFLISWFKSLGLNIALAKLSVMLIIVSWNFIIFRKLVFKYK